MKTKSKNKKTIIICGIEMEDDGLFAPIANESKDFTDEEWNNLDTGVSQNLDDYQWN